MKHPRELEIEDFNYPLPEERIAKFPLEERDASKLLVYQKGQIRESQYRNIADFLPSPAALVFNNTKVVQARMFFENRNGRKIELFCLEPADLYPDLTVAMSTSETVEWRCLVGGAKKWKEEILIKNFEVDGKTHCLKAEKLEALGGTFLIRFSWDPLELSFAEILDVAGITPLPPYLKRDAEAKDKDRYQTIYAAHDGSVAAPTAGLHFTPKVFETLATKNIEQLFVTLHVGAGTFKPVQSEKIADHEMHFEFIHVELKALEKIAEYLEAKTPIIPVGTTSMRTLESLYWLGLKVAKNGFEALQQQVEVYQWDPYEMEAKLSAVEAIQHLIDGMKTLEMQVLITRTQLMIAPGYQHRIVAGIVTNFHQPKSTLLLLIASIVGDEWKDLYNYALEHDFRFLSYGDGALLML